MSSGIAEAAPYSFDFSGTVTLATGVFAGASVGDPLSGTYTIDTAIETGSSENQTGSTQFNTFLSNDVGATRSGVYEISVTVGGVTRSTSGNSETSRYLLRLRDQATRDQWLYSALPESSSDDFASLEGLDNTPSPPDGIAAGTGNLTGVPILSPGNLGLYDFVFGRYTANDVAGATEGEVFFDVTSIVPEPGTALLLGLGLAGLAGTRRRS